MFASRADAIICCAALFINGVLAMCGVVDPLKAIALGVCVLAASEVLG